MARTAVLERVTWYACTVVALRDETATARTIALDVPDWPGHVAGQHVDVRLTAEDGYSAVRSYSIASPPSDSRLELTVERFTDGELSPYLTQELMAGDRLEIRGPIGGWFVWRPYQREPVQLIAGGSGVVPLMAMIRTRSAMQNAAPFRLLYSVREPAAVFYRHELATLDENGNGVNVSYAYTRATPEGWPRPPHRIDAKTLSKAVWPADAHPTCYVCGPTPFVETVSNLLIAAGHEAGAIKTERFGPTGERQ